MSQFNDKKAPPVGRGRAMALLQALQQQAVGPGAASPLGIQQQQQTHLLQSSRPALPPAQYASPPRLQQLRQTARQPVQSAPPQQQHQAPQHTQPPQTQATQPQAPPSHPHHQVLVAPHQHPTSQRPLYPHQAPPVISQQQHQPSHCQPVMQTSTDTQPQAPHTGLPVQSSPTTTAPSMKRLSGSVASMSASLISGSSSGQGSSIADSPAFRGVSSSSSSVGSASALGDAGACSSSSGIGLGRSGISSISGGYGSSSSSHAASALRSVADAASPPMGRALGRGALVAQFIINAHQQKLQSPRSQHPAATTVSSAVSEVSAAEASELASSVGRLELQRGSDEEPEEENLGKPAVIKRGDFGAKFSGSCNWLRVFLDPSKEVYEYAVFFEPEVDARNLRFKLLSSLHEHIGNTKSFDGATLWLPDRLKEKSTVLRTPNPVTREEVRVRLDLKRRTEMSQCVQLYNVLFSRVMRQLQMTKVGSNYYLPGARFLVPQHKLEIWPGYVTAAHYMETGVMLCVDTSHRVLRTTTAHEIMSVAARSNPDNFELSVKSVVLGSVVLTRYNNRAYIVDDIMFDQTPLSTFTNSRDEEMTYVDYYKRQYNIDIKDLHQPLFVHKLRKKEAKDLNTSKLVCLIPELCYMTGLTDEMRADFRVMKDIAQHTRLSPSARQECLAKFVANVNDTPEAAKILSDWGLTLDAAPMRLEGRVLPPELIRFKSRECPANDMADFSREATRERVLVPVDLMAGKWVIIFTGRDERTASQFLDMMLNVSRPLGIKLGGPVMVRIAQDRVDAYVAALREYHSKQLQLAVVIFSSQREDRYNAIKKVACSELGLPTQCIVARTISNEGKLRSVTVKIALQINCKLGGELWALKIPMAGLMVCGVDVYHDPTRRGSSVAGFVSSTNSTMTRWYSRATFQHPGDEIVSSLKVSMLEALKQYHKEQQQLPRAIIVYRDGVSEGQLTMVRDHELAQLSSVFRNFDDYQPKLTLVVVQKRINTRIYAALSGKSLNNPPPGSIIDHTITMRDWYDFLLVSQHVRQGTVSPTHYVVVHDGVGLKIDNLQRLTYKLTHLYYNWPGTIRVPAPCQYAHKLAYLMGQNVRKETHQQLQDKLFYL